MRGSKSNKMEEILSDRAAQPGASRCHIERSAYHLSVLSVSDQCGRVSRSSTKAMAQHLKLLLAGTIAFFRLIVAFDWLRRNLFSLFSMQARNETECLQETRSSSPEETVVRDCDFGVSLYWNRIICVVGEKGNSAIHTQATHDRCALRTRRENRDRGLQPSNRGALMGVSCFNLT